jgi:hypothetical protein
MLYYNKTFAWIFIYLISLIFLNREVGTKERDQVERERKKASENTSERVSKYNMKTNAQILIFIRQKPLMTQYYLKH